MNTAYDKIGAAYNATRKADLYITSRLYHLLCPVPGGKYLDIGCGTGNYLTALSQKGLTIVGIDPSETMLQQARAKHIHSTFISGCAENIPFPDNTFDGTIAVFTVHHWTDMPQGVAELSRVLKQNAKLVFLSFTPQQMKGYWLNHYFPKMMARALTVVPEAPGMEALLLANGFQAVQFEKYFVHPGLEDHFLYSSKYHPERYLVPEIRNNASAFSLLSDENEVADGLIKLEQDIRSGQIDRIIQQYENDLGDYLFIVCSNNKTMPEK